MADLPAIPLWTDAYLADCGHLGDAEHGRYLLILMHLWRAPKQRFPNDDDWLARKFGRSVDSVRSEIRPLLEEFCACDGNWITQKRLTREFEYVTKQRKKQSARAKARWNKEEVSCRGNATDGNAPTPTPTPPYSVSKDTGTEAPGEVNPVTLVFASGVRLLTAAGKRESEARSIVGGWRKRYPDEAILRAIGAAQSQGAIDPLSFIEGCLRRSGEAREHRRAGGALL